MSKKLLKKFLAFFLIFSIASNILLSTSANSRMSPKGFANSDANFTIQASDNVEQVLFNINNCQASKTFDFEFNLKPGEKLVSSSDFLGFDTGETFVTDENGLITHIIDAPWAKDANGHEIKTHYNITGNTLTQVVEHNCNHVFPITADPSIWQITVCCLQIARLISGVALPIKKILKIKKAVQTLGNLRLFAAIFIGVVQKKIATDALKKMGGKILLEAIEILLGFNDVSNACAFIGGK